MLRHQAQKGRCRSMVMLVCLLCVSGKLLTFRPAHASRQLHVDSAESTSRKFRIGLLGSPYTRRPYGLNFTEGVKVASDNSGNQVWEYGGQRLLDPSAVEFLNGDTVRSQSGATLQYPVDAFLLSTANLFRNKSIYGREMAQVTDMYMSMITRYKAPTIMVGLGTQVDFGSGVLMGANASIQWKENEVKPSSVILHPEQKKLYMMVKDSTGEVSVRGTFTRDVIVANGLPPPLPLGCPSLLINHDPRLGASLEAKRKAVLAARDYANLRLAVGLPAVFAHPNQGFGYYQSRPLVKFIAEHIMKAFPKSFVVIQTRDDVYTVQAMREHGVDLGPDRVKYFYDPEHWIEAMRDQADFMFSFRIHGSMAATAAGVPAIVISTDFRILELATGMRMATTSLADSGFDVRPFDVFNFVGTVPFDGAAFDLRRAEIAKQYAELFARLKLPLNPGIARIAAGAGVI